jgi:hypothetical protein
MSWTKYDSKKGKILFINKDKSNLLTNTKRGSAMIGKLNKIFEEIVYCKLFNDILFIYLSNEGTSDAIRLETNEIPAKVSINY